MKFTSSFLYAFALLFAMATVQAQDCTPASVNTDIDAQGSDGTIDFAASDSSVIQDTC